MLRGREEVKPKRQIAKAPLKEKIPKLSVGGPMITETLGKEHEQIAGMLEVLSKISSLIDSGASVNVADMEMANDFLTRFVDMCHHGKEEIVLFPAMKKHGGDQRLINELLHEHVEGRRKVRVMLSAVTKLGADGRKEYSDASREYRDLLIEHIRKEDDIAFPSADDMFSEDRKKEIIDQFEVIEEKRVGIEGHQQLLKNLNYLMEKYR